MNERLEIFEKNESGVRTYCRKFPECFDKGENSIMYTSSGKRYVDFFAGAGALNFGHNNPYIKGKIVDYLKEDNIIQGLDFYTPVTEHFLKTMRDKYFEPNNYDYRIMLCNASGANSVEAALKLARKNKNRTNIFAFTGSYHGQSLGALAATSGVHGRGGAGVPLNDVTFIPYATDLETEDASLDYIRWVLTDDHCGIDKPAAFLLECVQGEGGIKIASTRWLQEVRKICDEHDILMICDEIQSGVGRTGDYFSWERADIEPDMITVSKSVGGFGIPVAFLFVKPELDIFTPGEHTGTFRGNQLALLGAAATMEFFVDNKIDEDVKRKGKIVEQFMKERILPIDERLEARGLGLFWGIDFSKIDSRLTDALREECFKNHLVIDSCGREGCVIKLLSPLTIEDEVLYEGLDILEKSTKAIL